MQFCKSTGRNKDENDRVDGNVILYKYRNDSEYTESIFKKHKVWFAKPSELNDPLECSIQNIASDKISKIIEEEKELYYKAFNQVDRENEKKKSEYALSEIKQLIQTYGGFYKGVYSDKNLMDINNYEINCTPETKYFLTNLIIKRAGVFCLSENSDNALMWSHYGDSGKGIAIGFSISEKEDYNDFTDSCMLLKVNYSNQSITLEKIVNTTVGVVGTPNTKPIRFLVPEFTDPFIKSVFSSKIIDWAYEQEWRLVCEFSGEIKFNAPIAEIVFGPRCPLETKNKYIDLTKTILPYPVEFYEIIISGRNYKKAKMDIKGW